MVFLADTVALVWHLRRHRKLSERARQLFDGADAGEHTAYISAITLMELLGIIEQHELDLSLDDLLACINASPGYVVLPVDETIVQAASAISDVPELHDRVLVATAKLFEVPILTPDPVIAQTRHADVLW
jgi:PIN domain nuclease of toxin-antitoxin system